MGERSEREALHALISRTRRRKRWMAAIEGAALGAAGAALLATGVAAWMLMREMTPADPGATSMTTVWAMGSIGTRLWLALGSVVALGAMVGGALAAVRRVTLVACARAIDRAAWREDMAARATNVPGNEAVAHGPIRATDDLVLTALVLSDEGTSNPSPMRAAMVEMLVRQAVQRARAVSREVVTPPPRWQPLVLAGAAMIFLMVIVAVSGGARTHLASEGSNAKGARTARRAAPRALQTDGEGESSQRRVRLADLDAEQDAVKAAADAAGANGDAALARLAAEAQRLLMALRGVEGRDPARLIEALDTLSGAAAAAAEAAGVSELAEEDARAALRAAVGARDAQSLMKAIAEREAGPGAATDPNIEVLRRGLRGQRPLATAAASAARSLGHSLSASALLVGPAAEIGGAGTVDGLKRRLDPGPEPQAAPHESADDRQKVDDAIAASGEGERRQLEQLRRELDEAAAPCRESAEACAQKEEAAARALSRLEHLARTKSGRRDFARAARRLTDRLRGEGSAGVARFPAPDQAWRRFSEAARGLPGAGHAPSPRNGEDAPGASGQASGGDHLGPRAAESDDRSGAELGTAPPGARSATATNGTDQSDRIGDSAGIGAGIGTGQGGPVLGNGVTPGAPTASARDARVDIADSGVGPSRARVIGTAAASGFSSGEYRSVFRDYEPAIEEAMDTTAVSPGRRHLVRRYFQLIRPRSTP